MLRAARIDVRVDVDDLDVDRVVTDPVHRTLRTHGVRERRHRVLPILDVRRGYLEVVEVVGVEVVRREHVTRAEAVEPQVDQQTAQIQLEHAGVGAGLPRVGHHPGYTAVACRVDPRDVAVVLRRILDAPGPAGVRLVRTVAGEIDHVQAAVVDVHRPDPRVVDVADEVRHASDVPQHAERRGTVELEWIPRARIQQDEDGHGFDLMAIEVLVGVDDGEGRGAVPVSVGLAIPRDRSLGVDDLHHRDRHVGRIVRILNQPDQRVHVLEPPVERTDRDPRERGVRRIDREVEDDAQVAPVEPVAELIVE